MCSWGVSRSPPQGNSGRMVQVVDSVGARVLQCEGEIAKRSHSNLPRKNHGPSGDEEESEATRPRSTSTTPKSGGPWIQMNMIV